MLAAIAAFVIDRQFVKAASFSLAAAVLTFFGFMHGEAIGVGQSPVMAVAYLGVGGILLGCAKFAPATAAVPAHAHGEHDDHESLASATA
jgi:AGZA family xanthine/uracil permease-like MFS transporter